MADVEQLGRVSSIFVGLLKGAADGLGFGPLTTALQIESLRVGLGRIFAPRAVEKIERKIRGGDVIRIAAADGDPDHRFQFSQVPGPGVGDEVSHGLLVDPPDDSPVGLAEDPRPVISEDCDVLTALTQGRDRQSVQFEAIVELFEE